jgi:hypothetical protein
MLRSNEEGNRDAGGKPRAKLKQQRTVVWCGTEEERQEIREEPMRGANRTLSLARADNATTHRWSGITMV